MSEIHRTHQERRMRCCATVKSEMTSQLLRRLVEKFSEPFRIMHFSSGDETLIERIKSHKEFSRDTTAADAHLLRQQFESQETRTEAKRESSSMTASEQRAAEDGSSRATETLRRDCAKP